MVKNSATMIVYSSYPGFRTMTKRINDRTATTNAETPKVSSVHPGTAAKIVKLSHL